MRKKLPGYFTTYPACFWARENKSPRRKPKPIAASDPLKPSRRRPEESARSDPPRKSLPVVRLSRIAPSFVVARDSRSEQAW